MIEHLLTTEPMEFLDSSRPYPSSKQRRAAWQKEFASDGGAFRGAFEHAAIGMGLIDLDGRFLKVNGSLSGILGYSEDELLSTGFQSITHPDDLPHNVDLAAQLMRGEIDHYDLEKRCLHKSNRIIWVQTSVSLVRNEAGEPCFFVAQVQDISVRKSAEQESATRLRQVERLTQTVSGMLRALESKPDDTAFSDVLKTLLASLQSQAGVFLRFAPDGALVGRYVSEDDDRNTRVDPPYRCSLWEAALLEDRAQIENGPRPMACGRHLQRSLIAPIRHEGAPLGLLHLGDAPTDYDGDDLDLLKRVSRMIGPVVFARLERDKLTPREAEVMDLIVSGKSQKQIASQLAISVQTAAKHRAKVLDKLRVRNDVELVHRALEMRRLPT